MSFITTIKERTDQHLLGRAVVALLDPEYDGVEGNPRHLRQVLGRQPLLQLLCGQAH